MQNALAIRNCPTSQYRRKLLMKLLCVKNPTLIIAAKKIEVIRWIIDLNSQCAQMFMETDIPMFLRFSWILSSFSTLKDNISRIYIMIVAIMIKNIGVAPLLVVAKISDFLNPGVGTFVKIFLI